MSNKTSLVKGVKQSLTSWWEDRKGSYSDAWKDQLGVHKEASDYGGNDTHSTLSRIARQLARTVNVLPNATDKEGGERKLVIKYADYDSCENNPGNNDIILNPETTVQRPDIDALTGQVLTLQSMKRTASCGTFQEATTYRGSFAALKKELWQATEQAFARDAVLQDWEGFAPYFARHAAKTGSSRGDVQAWINSTAEAPDINAAVLGITWNLLHPGQPIRMPESYRAACAAGLTTLQGATDREQRFQVCSSAVEEMNRIINNPPPPEQHPEPQPGEGEGESKEGDDKQDGQGEGKGEQKDGDKDENKEGDKGKEDKGESGQGDGAGAEGDTSDSEAEPEPEEEPAKPCPAERPKLTDESLFGEVKTGRIDSRKIPDGVPINKIDEIDIQVPDGLCELEHTLVCTVPDTSKELYEVYRRMLRGQINAILKALQFRNTDTTTNLYGQPSGDLDDGSLHKLFMRDDNPTIWQRKEIISQPKIAVGILVDESGSMNSETYYTALQDDPAAYRIMDDLRSYKFVAGGYKIRPPELTTCAEEAKRVCIALQAALAQIKGIATMILGHNCDGCGLYKEANWHPVDGHRMNVPHPKTTGSEGQLHMYEYVTRQHGNPNSLVHMSSGCSNADGYAIEYAARKLAKDYEEYPTKLLFVISDGSPSAGGYGGDSAYEHMLKVCNYSRQILGVQTYAIGIANAFTLGVGELMYGPGRVIILKDVMSSLSHLTAFLTQIARKV